MSLQVQKVYLYAIHNKCNYMGQYYPEDDYFHFVAAKSMDELKEKLPKLLITMERTDNVRLFIMDGAVDENGKVYVPIEDRLEWGGDPKRVLPIGDENSNWELADKLFNETLQSEAFKKLVEERKKRKEEQERKVEEKLEAEGKEKRRAQFLKLREEFKDEQG